MRKLKTVIITKHENQNMSTCAICLETCTGKCLALTECGHIYHPSCISKWFTTAKKKNGSDGNNNVVSGVIMTAPCVICKVEFDINETIAVYLDHEHVTPNKNKKRRRQRLSSPMTMTMTRTKVNTNNELMEKKKKKKKKKNRSKEEEDEDVVIINSDSELEEDDEDDDDEDDDVMNDVDLEQYQQLEKENEELEHLLREAKRKAREAEDNVVINKCNNEAFAQTQKQLEALQQEFINVCDECKTAKSREQLAANKVKNLESWKISASKEVNTLRDDIAALKSQQRAERSAFSLEIDGTHPLIDEEKIARLMNQKDKKLAIESLCVSLKLKTKHMLTLQEEYNKVVKKLRLSEKSLRDLEMKYAKRKSKEKKAREELEKISKLKSTAERLRTEEKHYDNEEVVLEEEEEDDDDDDDLIIIGDRVNSSEENFIPAASRLQKSNILRDANTKVHITSLSSGLQNLNGANSLKKMNNSFSRNNNESGSFIKNGDDFDNQAR
jgi:hypothetical protein